MSPALKGLVEDLASTSDATFHRALGRLLAIDNVKGSAGVRLVVEVIVELTERGELGERVRADRVHAILRRIELNKNALSELAVRAREFPPGVRNSVATFLAPDQHRLLLSASRVVGEPIDLLASPSPAEIAPVVNPTSELSSSGTVLKDRSFSTVALLAGPFQDANKQLLSSRGFGPLVWTSIENLEQDLAGNGDVCACVVDGSVLQTLGRDEQLRLFKLLAEYSTFLWIRVEDSHLKITASEVRSCIRSARCLREEVPAALLSFQGDSTLREREVDDIECARRLLIARDEAQFTPGELTGEQARVLMAAANQHAQELQMDGRVSLKSLEAKFVSGGRSSARIAVLRVNQGIQPIVAKIDKKDRILDEMRRFRTYIELWDNQLRPKLYFHGEAAVLLFGLIPDEQDPAKPADVFDSRLEELWNDQLFESKPEREQVEVREALAAGAENAAKKIRELNSRRPARGGFAPLGNPDVAVFHRLARTGFDWGLPESAIRALSKAEERFRLLENAATVHGDVHLKNILLRDDSLPYLIDYAGSGPGHPCVDLVRLELALFLGPLRQTEPEEKCAEYQVDLTFGGAQYPDLEHRFDRLHRCHLNVVCLRGIVAARDQAISVLRDYGGSDADYQAVKYLVAWQNLVMMGRQTGLARAMISAFAPKIAEW